MIRLDKRPFLLYVPDGTGPHPVLCFLHGFREAAVDRNGAPQPLGAVLTNQSPAWQAENGSAFVSPFLVVCPQLNAQRRWEPADAAWVDAFVEMAIAEHHGDPSRMTLTGFSYGGEGAFQIASTSRMDWSTIWAVDPALQRMPPLPAADVRVWVHRGAQQPGAQNMPRLVDALTLKQWGGRSAARRVLAVLNTDHPRTCAAAYGQAGVYEWLVAT
jgi:hypothetical protein